MLKAFPPPQKRLQNAGIMWGKVQQQKKVHIIFVINTLNFVSSAPCALRCTVRCLHFSTSLFFFSFSSSFSSSPLCCTLYKIFSSPDRSSRSFSQKQAVLKKAGGIKGCVACPSGCEPPPFCDGAGPSRLAAQLSCVFIPFHLLSLRAGPDSLIPCVGECKVLFTFFIQYG